MSMQLDYALLIIVCGLIAGFSFGLTAGGGSVVAVPLLVYIVQLEAHKGICVSMLTFALMAGLASFRDRQRVRIDSSARRIVGVGGIVSAPIGAWLNHAVSARFLLISFSSVVLVIATRMFLGTPTDRRSSLHSQTDRERIFVAIGVLTGLLAGLLGIGGGFIIVPSLVLFCGFEILKAIQTAFLSIALISISAATAHFIAGQRIPILPTILFVAGAITGTIWGLIVGEKLSPKRLQRLFAVALFTIGLAMFIHNVE